ncbi:Ser-Thr-rich glycosyl-phosphatidyl-inositol-anchored membrane family, putative [Entamoeba histolytica]
MIISLLFITILVVYSRPIKPPHLGDGFIQRGNHYEYGTNNKLKGDNGETELQYSVDIKPNVHSFDFDESIESVECQGDDLIVSTNNKYIETWSNNSLVTGSNEMWKSSCTLNRRILNIELMYEKDGLYYYLLRTEKVSFNEYFNEAKLIYNPKNNGGYNKENKRKGFRKVHFKEESNIDASTVKISSIPTEVVQRSEYIEVKTTEKTLPFNIETPIGVINVVHDDYYCISYSLIKGSEDIEGEMIFEVYSNEKPITNIKFINSFINFFKNIFERHKTYTVKDNKYSVGEIYTKCIKIDNTYKENKSYTVKMKMEGYKEKEGPMFYVEKDESLIVTTPIEGEFIDYTKTKEILVKWEYTNAFKYTQGVKMKLKMNRLGIDKTIGESQQINKFSNKEQKFIIDDKHNIRSSSSYYIEMRYNCWNVPVIGGWCSTKRSNLFTISNEEVKGEIEIKTPTLGQTFKTGEEIVVTWEYSGDNSNKEITIELKKNRRSSIYNIKRVKASEKQIKIRVPEVKEDTKYFIEIEYQKGNDKQYSYSDFFYINSEKVIEFDDDIKYDNDKKQLSFKFKTLKHQKLDKSYITIKEDYPLFLRYNKQINDKKYNIETMTIVDKKDYYEYSMIINDFIDNSIFYLYLSYNYKCKINEESCKSQYSKRFSIPYEKNIGWNIKEDGNIKEKEINIMNVDCSICPTDNTYIKKQFCRLCDILKNNSIPIYNSTITTTCEDCYVVNNFKIGPILFEIGFQNPYKFEAQINGHLDLQFNFKNKLIGTMNFQHTFDIPKISLKNILTIILGKIPFEFDASIDSGFTVDFQITGSANIDTTIKKELEYTLYISYPNINTNDGTYICDYAQLKIEDTKEDKIFKPTPCIHDTELNLTITPYVGMSFSTSIFDITPKLEFPLINLVKYSEIPFIGTNDKTLAKYVYGLENDHYMEYTLDIYGKCNLGYKIKLVISNTQNEKRFKIFGPIKAVRIGFLDIETVKKTRKIPLKITTDMIKEYEDETKEIIKLMIEDIIKYIEETKLIRIESNEYFINDTKQTIITTNDQYAIIDIAIKEELISIEDIKQICDILKETNQFDSKYVYLKAYSHYIKGCSNITLENEENEETKCEKYEHCSLCSSSECLKCEKGYGIDEEGKCRDVECNNFKGCSKCTVTECLECSNGKDTYNNKCLIEECEQFNGCLECTTTECSKCNKGYEMIHGECKRKECSMFEKCVFCNNEECLECEETSELIDGACKIDTCDKFEYCSECTDKKCIKCKETYTINEKGICELNKCTEIMNCNKCSEGQCYECLDKLEMINGICYQTTCSSFDKCFRCDDKKCIQCVDGTITSDGICRKEEMDKESIYCLMPNYLFVEKEVGNCTTNSDKSSDMVVFNGKEYLNLHYPSSPDCGINGDTFTVITKISLCVKNINKINSKGYIYKDNLCGKNEKISSILTSSGCISYDDGSIKSTITTNELIIEIFNEKNCNGNNNKYSYNLDECFEDEYNNGYKIITGEEYECSTYGECLKCNETECSKCGNKYTLTSGKCYFNCEEYQHCSECDDMKCNRCKEGYEMKYGECEESHVSGSISKMIISLITILTFLI